MRVWLAIVVTGLFGGLALAAEGGPEVGSGAPEVESTDLKGNRARLSDLRGKVVVLDVWATWCGPCRAMIPHERDMVERLKSKPFVLVSLSLDAKKETLQEFISKEPMPWTHWHMGAKSKFAQDWQIKSIPSIYVLDQKGVVRFKNVRGEKLEEAVKSLLNETGNSQAAYLRNRALDYLRAGKLDFALTDCNQAIRLDPNDAQSYRCRASVYLRKGDYDLALKDSTQAIRIDPKVALAYNERGAAYSYLDKYDEAIADYSQAIQLQPREALFYRNRGSSLAHKGEYEKAIADFTEAIRLDPRDAKAYWRRGQAHDKTKLPDKAKADYAEAVRIDPRLAKQQ